MAKQFGYAGKILRVDLSSQSATDSPTSDYSDRFLGGRGMAAKIYWDEVSPQAGAFDSENELLFVTGPLAGFPGLAGSRWQVCGRSPSTAPALPEFFSYANLGGSWGAQLKFARYDGIVVRGKSDKPVYLLVQDGKAEIRDASHLWGKGALEVREILKAELGEATRIAAIGPAGENMAMMATVLADDDASGSSGLGAVMGSKSLKAIAVRGTGTVTAWNQEKLGELRKYVRELRGDAPTIYPSHFWPFVSDSLRMKKAACYGCISGCDRAIYQAEDGTKGKFLCMPPFIYKSWAENYYGKFDDTSFHAT